MVRIKATKKIHPGLWCRATPFLKPGGTATITQCFDGAIAFPLSDNKRYKLVRDGDKEAMVLDGYEFLKEVVEIEAE